MMAEREGWGKHLILLANGKKWKFTVLEKKAEKIYCIDHLLYRKFTVLTPKVQNILGLLAIDYD